MIESGVHMPSQESTGDGNRVLVVIPTYNEADNLPTLIAELRALEVSGLRVMVVDDNSPDGTGAVADDLARRYPGDVEVRHRQAKAGLGRAYLDGFAQALDAGADYIIQMDADFSHPPRAILSMLEEILKYDVVVGSRYVAGGELDKRWSWWRRFLSWWANEVWSRGILGLEGARHHRRLQVLAAQYAAGHRAGTRALRRLCVPGRDGLSHGKARLSG